MAKIYYKTKEIDYERTMGELDRKEFVIIPTADRDIENIRANVSRAAKRLPDDRVFRVNKTINGARIQRIDGVEMQAEA